MIVLDGSNLAGDIGDNPDGEVGDGQAGAKRQQVADHPRHQLHCDPYANTLHLRPSQTPSTGGLAKTGVLFP